MSGRCSDSALLQTTAAAAAPSLSPASANIWNLRQNAVQVRSCLADISIEDDVKPRSLRWGTVRMADKPDENSGVTVDHNVGLLSHLLDLLFKIVNLGKSLSKLLLKRFKGRRGHGVVG